MLVLLLPPLALFPQINNTFPFCFQKCLAREHELSCSAPSPEVERTPQLEALLAAAPYRVPAKGEKETKKRERARLRGPSDTRSEDTRASSSHEEEEKEGYAPPKVRGRRLKTSSRSSLLEPVRGTKRPLWFSPANHPSPPRPSFLALWWAVSISRAGRSHHRGGNEVYHALPKIF